MLIRSLQKTGIMFPGLRIQLTMPQEIHCQLKSWNTAYGGVGPLGYDLHLAIGLCTLIFLQIMFVRNYARYLMTAVQANQPIIPLNQYSSFTHLQWAWLGSFILYKNAELPVTDQLNLISLSWPWQSYLMLKDIRYTFKTSNSCLKSVHSKLSNSYQRTATYCLFIFSWIKVASFVLGVERATQSCHT